MTFDQSEFQIRCEWGLRGLTELAPISDVLLIIDVLSFTTSVEIATSRGGIIFPYPLKDDSAAAYAKSVNARLASHRDVPGFSLSPASLQNLPAGYRLVLSSPNGAALSCKSNHPVLLAVCLRNAAAAAKMAAQLGTTFAVVPAGETWNTGELRPSLEDLIGAGALIDRLPGSRSPEASLALAAFHRFQHDLPLTLRTCSSGKELLLRGFGADIDLAAQLNVSLNVPRLINNTFTASF